MLYPLISDRPAGCARGAPEGGCTREHCRLWPYLATVLRDELVFLDRVFDENAPACHIGRRQQEMLEDGAQWFSQSGAKRPADT